MAKKPSKTNEPAPTPPRDELAAALEKIGAVFAQGVQALQQLAQTLTPGNSAAAPPHAPANTARTAGRKAGRRSAPPVDDTPRTAAGPMRKVGREWVPADADPDDAVGLATIYPDANIKPQRRLEKERLAQANGRAAHVSVGEQSGMAGAFGAKATGAAKDRLRAGLAGG